MEEKVFTKKEIHDTLKKVVNNYLKHYQSGKMNFSEFAIIDNLIMRLEFELGVWND